jgi:polysaccharide biosynthesis/export protein
LIDPECGGLPRLICEFNDQLPPTGDDMKLDDPEKKLSVPVFHGSKNNNENDRFSPPTLTPYDMHIIRDSVKNNQRRRKSFISSRIRVCVDGKELTNFDARDGKSCHCNISSSSSYVEVFGQDEFGDLLLAFFPLSSLNCFDSGEPSTFVIQAEGKQRVHCLIIPESNDNSEIISGLLEIKYKVPQLNLAIILGYIKSIALDTPLLWLPRVALILFLLVCCMLHLGGERRDNRKQSLADIAPNPNTAVDEKTRDRVAPVSPTTSALKKKVRKRVASVSTTPPVQEEKTTERVASFSSSPPASTDDTQMFKDVIRRFTETYRLNPADALTIRVKGHSDYSIESVKISPEGTIYHPYLGDIGTGGLTIGQLKKLLVRELSEYILDPNVTVELLESQSAKVVVIGDVKVPRVRIPVAGLCPVNRT